MTSAAPVPVVLATTPADAAAVEAVRTHHAELSGRIAALTSALTSVVASDMSTGAVTTGAEHARAALLAFCHGELLPHAVAEEATLYAAASALPSGSLLVEALVQEHDLLTRLVGQVGSSTTLIEIVAAAQALLTVFDSHVVKENELVLPLLASDPGTSLADLLGSMHEQVGGAADDAGCSVSGTAPHACGCGEPQADAVPLLDVRQVPHMIRHATVFGAFDAIGHGASLDLVAPHDPVPLLRHLHDRAGGRLDVTYLERGPAAWCVRLTRA